MSDAPLMTTEEVAAYLRRSKMAVYQLVSRGRLRPLPGSPGRLLFTREAVERFLTTRPPRQKKAAAAAEPAGVTP